MSINAVRERNFTHFSDPMLEPSVHNQVVERNQGESSLQERAIVVRYQSPSYGNISLPEGLKTRNGLETELNQIRSFCNIRNQSSIVPGLGESDWLLRIIHSCTQIAVFSSVEFKAHFLLIATQHVRKFLAEFFRIQDQIQQEDVSKTADVINRFFNEFEKLEDREKDTQETDLLLRGFIQLFNVQGDKKSRILPYLGIGGRHFLYSQFVRCCESGERGFAKTVFFYYVKSTPANQFFDKAQGGEEKQRVREAVRYLQDIFRSFEKKSYIPVNVSTAEDIPLGVVKIIEIDLFLLNFLRRFGLENGTKFNPEDTDIIDWSFFYSQPPEYMIEKREVYKDLVSATSATKLNSVGDTQIICKNEVTISTGVRKHIKVDRETKEQVQRGITYENEVLSRLTSLDKKERAKDERERNSSEKIEENSVDADHLREMRDHRDLSREEAEGQSAKTLDKASAQRSRAKEKEWEEAGRWQVSQLDATEDGIEIADTRRTSHEESRMDEDSVKNTFQTSKQGSRSGGSILGFFSWQSEGSGNTVDKKETGSTHREGRVDKQESEQAIKTNRSKRKEQEKSVEGESRKKREEKEEESTALEKEREKQDDYRVTLLKKNEFDTAERLQNRIGVKSQGKRLEDSETDQRRVESLEDQRESGYSVRNKFNFERVQNVLNLRSQEHTQDELHQTTIENTETFCLKQGYLLVSKVEYTRKITLTPVKFVIEFVYLLKNEAILELKQEDLPPYLHPLYSRLQAVENRRFYTLSPEAKIDAGPVSIKNLALEIWNDEKASKDRANQLNTVFHRLGRFLDQVSGRISEQAWAEYHRHRDNYLEEASLKYCEDAFRSLSSMFQAFREELAVCGSETFLRLHAELQALGDQKALSSGQSSSPKTGSGALLHKENAHGILLGNNQLTWQDSYKNLLVVGSVGCGKTSRIIIPNLFQLQDCSVLVTDVDGEIYEKTAGIMEKKGFDVRVFDILGEGKEGDRFNPFDDLTVDSYDSIRRMVSCIMKARGFDETKGEKDAFWVIGGKMILELALRLLIQDKADKKIGEATLEALYEKVGSLTQEQVESFAKKEEDKGRKVESDALRQMARFVQSSGSSFSDRASYAKSATENFISPVVKALTGKSTINLLEIRKKPTVIYLKIKQAQLSHYQFLLSLFYTRFFATCYQESNVGQSGLSRSLPVVCLMDEFGHTPIPDFQTVLTTNRKHEIAVVSVVQSVSQLKELYGEQNASTMLGGGFASKLYFPLDISDVQIARDMSEAYGKIIGRTGQTFEHNTGSVSHTEGEKEGLQIQEVLYPGEGYATFLHMGHKPVKIRLTPYFENDRFHGLMQQPVESKPLLLEPLVERTAFLSKEEAIEELVSLCKERKPVNAAMIRKMAHSKSRKEFEGFLLRQNLFPTQGRIFQLIEHIYGNWSELFKSPRFLSLDPQSKEHLRACFHFANEAHSEEILDALVEMLDLLYEKGFRSSEIAALTHIGNLMTKLPKLGLLIFQDFALEYRLGKGQISDAEILKGIESLKEEGFSRDETAEYWKSLIDVIKENLSQYCDGKIGPLFKPFFAQSALKKLVDLYPSAQLPRQRIQILTIIDELMALGNLSILLKGKTLMIQGVEWQIVSALKVRNSSAMQVQIKNGNVEKVIRFDQGEGSLGLYEIKQP